MALTVAACDEGMADLPEGALEDPVESDDPDVDVDEDPEEPEDGFEIHEPTVADGEGALGVVAEAGDPDAIPGSIGTYIRPTPGVGQDALVISHWSTDDNNYGNRIEFGAGAWTAGAPYSTRGFLKFNLQGLPRNRDIIKATLSLYGNMDSNMWGAPGHRKLTSSNAFVLRRVTADWDEDTITWNNQPPTSSQDSVSLPESTYASQPYPGIVVTSMFQDMKSNPLDNHGLMLRLQTEQRYTSIKFGSSDLADLSRRPLLSMTLGPERTMDEWTQSEVDAYAATHLAYFQANTGLLDMHEAWHNRNGSGGTVGTGSGVAFLGFHRAMMNHLDEFAYSTGGQTVLPVRSNGEIPTGLPDATPVLGSEARPRNSTIFGDAVGTPAWLTMDGVTVGTRWANTTAIVFDDPNDNLAPYTVETIRDIKNLDHLGQIIGRFYHGSGHMAIGGTMASFASPADPIFYGWHGHLDVLIDRWLLTSNGRQWVEDNEGHPFLQHGFTHFDGWENDEWD